MLNTHMKCSSLFILSGFITTSILCTGKCDKESTCKSLLSRTYDDKEPDPNEEAKKILRNKIRLSKKSLSIIIGALQLVPIAQEKIANNANISFDRKKDLLAKLLFSLAIPTETKPLILCNHCQRHDNIKNSLVLYASCLRAHKNAIGNRIKRYEEFIRILEAQDKDYTHKA